ncbi:hypothetical protein ACHAXA_011912 [Cyclostephanos tholiformis]|uniref:Uncharacterized protein n=1 Tax=Cyclostephanos tholiformis TaxID=382380 RepID=A0ABD3SC99_9STRA
MANADGDITPLMAEIPLVIHCPPLPLPLATTGWEEEIRRRSISSGSSRAVVHYAAIRNNRAAVGATTVIGVELTESTVYDGRRHSDASEDDYRCDFRGLTSVHHSKSDDRLIFTSGVPGRGMGVIRVTVSDAGGDGGNGGNGGPASVGGEGGGGMKEKDILSSFDVDISSLMDGGGRGSAAPSFNRPVETAVFVTSSSCPPLTLPQSGNTVANEEDDNDNDPVARWFVLHLRMVDASGSVLSLSFAYPEMSPAPGGSFLLPFSPPKRVGGGGSGRRASSSSSLRPHPGSSVEYNQACFPTPSTVVFAMNPHLYCVDLGGIGVPSSTRSITRVWTSINNIIASNPVAEDDRPACEGAENNDDDATMIFSAASSTPAPRKRLRESLGTVLTMATRRLMGIPDYDPDAECEYADNEDDDDEGGGDGVGHRTTGGGISGGGGGGGVVIPPIAALTGLSSNEDSVARVVTLHSDGSLRVWTAEPSRRESSEGRLRVPSMMRVVVRSRRGSNDNRTAADTRGGMWYYSDPPIPNPSKWNTCRDALTMRGNATCDSMSGRWEYEIALCIRCYSNPRTQKESGGSIYIFRGTVESANAGAENEARILPSGETAKMQTLALPKGTASVVDISWSSDHDLMVLHRQRINGVNGASETYYDIGDEMENGRVVLSLYSLEESSYSSQPSLPLNMTLPYLDFNHFGYSNPLPEEELDRYMCPMNDESRDIFYESKDMKNNACLTAASNAATSTLAAAISQAQAQVDRAGLLAILQPFGRTRPSALAVYRAMSSLNLLDDDVSADVIRPLAILSAMRKWNKRSMFKTSSALVLADNEDNKIIEKNSPIASNSISIYQAFTSATKSFSARNTRMNDVIDLEGESDAIKSEANEVEEAPKLYRLKWIRLLSEIRRQEAQLEEVLFLASSANINLLFRGSMISVFTLGCEIPAAAEPANRTLSVQDRENMVGLDELAVDLFTCITSNPDLRKLLSKVESALYDGASKASSFVHGWANKSLVDLMYHLEALGSSAMMRIQITDAQIQLLNTLSQLDSKTFEKWLMPNLSVSSPVSKHMAVSNPFSTNIAHRRYSYESDSLFSATAIVSARIESIRRLSLSRLVLIFGSPQKNSLTIQHGALRSTLYCTALSWSVNQVSITDKYLTLLEEDLLRKMNSDLGLPKLTAALELADIFVSNAFDNMFGGAPVFVKIEPRIALRLLAPLVEFRSTLVSSEVEQKMWEVAADGLLLEAAAFPKLAERAGFETSQISLWRLASTSLLHITATTKESSNVIWTLINRVGFLERHLDSMVDHSAALPLCCGVILEAIQDATSSISSHASSDSSIELTSALSTLLNTAFQTSMRGQLWDDALQSCIANPSNAQRNTNFKRLILGMINAGALGKIIDMSLTVVGSELSILMRMNSQEGATDRTVTEVDLFSFAAEIIEEAAIEQTTASLLPEVGTSDGHVMNNRPNYCGCLFALHASRGHWRQAARAMDMFGKATADSVSSSKTNPIKPTVLSKAASKKVMDDACLSSQACVHAISLIDEPSRRYLLPGNKNVPTEARLLTEEDLERRAARALALRIFSMDQYSPDSVGGILEMASRDTIDSLARFGYYDQAISVALGVSSKRKGLPGGVDLFDDAVKYILCTYLVPAATKSNATEVGDCCLEGIQSRSKIAQICASSSACVLGSDGKTPVSQLRVTSGTANAMSWVPNCRSENALHSTMAMNLLQQYTTVHSKRCPGLGLIVAKSIMGVGDGLTQLPPWLKKLCIFGISSNEEIKGGLFAMAAGKGIACIPDPAGLMRLYIKHHQYGEACDVVTSVLSTQRALDSNNAASSRLPEKGSIDYVPYDLIDMLWDMIECIITANSSSASDAVCAQIHMLLKKRNGMERALEAHFESLKTNEEGLISARRLSHA